MACYGMLISFFAYEQFFFKRIFCCAKHGLHIISILAKKVPGNWSEMFFLGISLFLSSVYLIGATLHHVDARFAPLDTYWVSIFHLKLNLKFQRLYCW